MRLLILCICSIFFSKQVVLGQEDQECKLNLSLFYEAGKKKDYDAAYEPWMATRKKCPKLNKAIYIYGERILKDKIKKTSKETKTDYLNDLLKLYDESMVHMPRYFKVGATLAKKAQLKYENSVGSNDEIYLDFDRAYTQDAESFRSPRRLYYYFESLYKSYQEKGSKITVKEVFDKYEDLKEKFELEHAKLVSSLDKIDKKEKAGEPLTKGDFNIKKVKELLQLFEKNMDKLIEGLANCDNLITMYTKSFDKNKENTTWLRGAAGRMVAKECTSNPLFVKIVDAYYQLEPSAESAGFLGDFAFKKKEYKKAKTYYEESAQLHEDKIKKAKMYFKIAQVEMIRGVKSSARNYAHKALAQQPNHGKAYLLIAKLYASSANDCGNDVFEKKAVYWVAEKMAIKAGQVDPAFKSDALKDAAHYKGNAPSKQDIFVKGYKGGEVIQIGCWMNTSVTIPAI